METTQTPEFKKWFKKVSDPIARRQILIRIARIEAGLMGDVESVGGGVSEVRIHLGQGYRLYFTVRGGELVILLCGGTKGSQDRDIGEAKKLAGRY